MNGKGSPEVVVGATGARESCGRLENTGVRGAPRLRGFLGFVGPVHSGLWGEPLKPHV